MLFTYHNLKWSTNKVTHCGKTKIYTSISGASENDCRIFSVILRFFDSHCSSDMFKFQHWLATTCFDIVTHKAIFCGSLFLFVVLE